MIVVKQFLLIENIFYQFLPIWFFFTYFYSDAFSLHIHGNGGFIGSYLSVLNSLIKINETIFIIYLLFNLSFF